MTARRFPGLRALHLYSVVLISLTLFAAAEARPVRVGVVAVDLQEHFVRDAMINPATPAALQATAEIFALAAQHQTPFFVTYERDNAPGYDMPGILRAALPPSHRAFFKTTYAATGLPPFVTALKDEGITHVVLAGAETDVCVMLTALGLRELGYEVFVAKDAVFSSELNVDYAWQRMKRAGVHAADQTFVKQLLSGKAVPPPAPPVAQLLFDPIKDGAANSALILSATLSPEAMRGCNAVAKMERLSSLIIFAEWLQIPVYVAGNLSDVALLSDPNLALSEAARQSLERLQLKPIDTLKTKRYEFIAMAGEEGGLLGGVSTLSPDQRRFVLKDATFKLDESAGLSPSLREFIPISFKTYYREMTGSVSFDDWASPDWVERAATFEQVLKDPEAMSPVVARCTQEIGESGAQEIR